jgi:dipeptidyl aminopeptidase/acylaminoacyl peptidase
LSPVTDHQERLELFAKYVRSASLIGDAGGLVPRWMADGSSFWYATGEPNDTTILRVDPTADTVAPLFDVARVRAGLASLLRHEPIGNGLPFRDFLFVDDERTALVTVEERLFLVSVETGDVSAWPGLPPSPAEKQRTTPQSVRKGFLASTPDVMEVLSPDKRWFAGVRDGNLALRSTADGRSQLLTHDADEDVLWDVELAQWSPDSLRLAVTRIDRRGVLRLPVVHWLKQTEEVEWFPYTKAGGPMPQASVHIVEVFSKTVVSVEAGADPDERLEPLAWRPDGSELLVLGKSRCLDRLRVLAVDPLTGATRTVLDEQLDTFYSWGDLDALCTVSDSGSKIVWRSERDGWAHLYLYDVDEGTLLSQLTSGSFPVKQVVAVDEDKGVVYFLASAEERLYDTHLYSVDFEGKNLTRLTDDAGRHICALTPSKKFFLDYHSSIDRPPRTDLRTADGTFVRTLTACDIRPLEEIGWREAEEFTVLAADGVTELHGIMFKPHDFDPAKRYPVIDAIYGGPQLSLAPRHFLEPGIPNLGRALAQLGAVAIVVDARGTPGRSKAFHDAVHLRFGQHEIPDHAAAIRQLGERHEFLDTSRVGIFGGSWGGYFTIRALLTAPETFHVGVATCPVADLYDHMAAPIEPYMGLPQENREGYEAASNLAIAGNLRGKLLLIHGTSDVNATFSAVMKLVDAFARAKKPYDLIVLPEVDHHPVGAAAEYWVDAHRRYFTTHLELEVGG